MTTQPKGAFATLTAIFRLTQVRIYHAGRDDEHQLAGEICAIGLYDNGLGVRFEAAPYGFRLEIENPGMFYRHPKIKEAFREFPGDRLMYEIGGANPALKSFFGLEEYRQAIRLTTGDPRELTIPESALRAFIGALNSWRPANDDENHDQAVVAG